MESEAGLKLRVSNEDGNDFDEGMVTASVGEAAKRFTREEVVDGTMRTWMEVVCALITAKMREAKQ
jgi:hypothetical protein